MSAFLLHTHAHTHFLSLFLGSPRLFQGLSDSLPLLDPLLLVLPGRSAFDRARFRVVAAGTLSLSL